ncbi:hypothetical protein SAMN02745116_00188 [Pilibacter termitis]|uniref:Uncharacterized protein n=1 Tax=Pilibacter termitis TaxID=263852 RepID=A0A1T4KCG1_9ENTE|nr:pectate lyase-like adhesive domain-containing protein [Pilibacter termitis]SJZ40057.1 hypothetical protein SAMN02745116_00188 [Pilibacter termitis]
MTKKRIIVAFLVMVLFTNVATISVSNPILAVENGKTAKVQSNMNLTLADEDHLTVKKGAKTTYTLDFKDADVNQKAIYSLVLPEGVEKNTLFTTGVDSYDEKTRTLELKAPKSNKEATSIALDFDLENNTELVVQKTLNGLVSTSVPLYVEVTEKNTTDSGAILPVAPQVVSSPKATRGITPRGFISGETAHVENWMEFFDAMSNNSVFHIVLEDNIVIPNTASVADGGTGQDLGAMYRAAHNGNSQPNTSNHRADALNWRTTTNTSGGDAYFGFNRTQAGCAKELVIDGQGQYAIDTGSICFTWHDGFIRSVRVKDLTTYNGNYYGFMTLNDIGADNQLRSTITYENYIAKGTQMMHAPYTMVKMEGYVANIQDDTGYYQTPFRTGTSVANGWRYNYQAYNYMECNLYAGKLDIMDNAQVYLYSSNSGNIDLNGPMVVHSGAVIHASSSFKMSNGSPNTAGFEDDTRGVNIELENLDTRIGNANLKLEEGSRVFLYEDKSKHDYGALSLRSANSKVEILDGATLEVYSTEHTNTVFAESWRPIVYLADGAIVDISSYGRLSVFATGMQNGMSPICVAGNAQFNIKKDGILDVVADTTDNLIKVNGTNAKIIFDDAYRVNLARISSTNRPNNLIGTVGAGDTIGIQVKNQRVAQWDSTAAVTLKSSSLVTDTNISGTHENPIPALNGAYPFGFEYELDDENFSREWLPIYSLTAGFSSNNYNAVNSGIKTYIAADSADLKNKFGRSTDVFNTDVSSTTGNKPNRILFTKLYDIEVQLFSTLTDNSSLATRTFTGDVTRGIEKGATNGFATDSNGDYKWLSPTVNKETLSIDYDPRCEIVGRTGVVVEHMKYNYTTKKMEMYSTFVPVEDALVKLLPNGSVNPVSEVHSTTFNGVEKPLADKVVNLSNLSSDALVGSTFADGKYSKLSSKENDTVTTSKGTQLRGGGYFVYTLPNNGVFVAEDLVKVSAYKDGKEFTYGETVKKQSLRVLDETSPTAEPKDNAYDKNSATSINHSSAGILPTPASLIQNEQDSNPYSSTSGFYSREFDYTTPTTTIAGVIPITSQTQFETLVADLSVDETQIFSIGIVVKDKAGNPCRVDTVFFKISRSTIGLTVSDVYIYESDFKASRISQGDVTLLKYFLVQQGISNVHYEVKDDNDSIIVSKNYQPDTSAIASNKIFRVDELNGLDTQQTPGVVYQVEASLVAEKANPGKNPANGIAKDVPITFNVMIIPDARELTGSDTLDFGTHSISGLTPTGEYSLDQQFGSLVVKDNKNMYDTSQGSEANKTLVYNAAGNTETILTGKVDDISKITKRNLANVPDTWKISAQLTKPLTEVSTGRVLRGVIYFGTGKFTSDNSSAVVNKEISAVGGSVELINGNTNVNKRKGEHSITFNQNEVKLRVPESEKSLGSFEGEITYTYTSTPTA